MYVAAVAGDGSGVYFVTDVYCAEDPPNELWTAFGQMVASGDSVGLLWAGSPSTTRRSLYFARFFADPDLI